MTEDQIDIETAREVVEALREQGQRYHRRARLWRWVCVLFVLGSVASLGLLASTRTASIPGLGPEHAKWALVAVTACVLGGLLSSVLARFYARITSMAHLEEHVSDIEKMVQQGFDR